MMTHLMCTNHLPEVFFFFNSPMFADIPVLLNESLQFTLIFCMSYKMLSSFIVLKIRLAWQTTQVHIAISISL